MTSVKIYPDKNSKQPVKVVIDNISFNDIKQKVSVHGNFKLMFDTDKKNSYIPEELLSDGIYDEVSLQFFKDKLSSKGIKNGKYAFYIVKVDSLPTFKKKENSDILDANLKKYWNLALNDITSDLNLMKLEESKNTFEKMKEEQKKKENDLKKIKHDNIICSNCFQKDFCGKRFICSECNNYNLCQDCEKILQTKEIHQRDHVLIQINTNIKEDLSKYNNVIGNYHKEFQNVEEFFTLEFVVVNNGENDLKNCCILPIRYGDEYLSCDAKIITNSIKRGMNLKISLDVKTPQRTGYFEGYFRMFTPSGLPIGNIIYIKVLNGN
jgi:hypothetical protein